jgi:hypothetical protein
MATVTPPRTKRNLEQDRSRIKSPLARLRKYIHGYVSLEGAALVGLFLALWFWIGLLLDYGVFKASAAVGSSIDWVQVLPWGFRLTVLVAFILAALAIVALKIVTRLFIDFTDAAVALVLERRFPKLLGDRLITAVEMSDPAAAAAHGYSADMVRETIHEAADRVDQVPVKEVFDWRRLFRRGVLFGLLTLGLYLLVGAGFSAVRAISDESPAAAGYSDLNDVSTIWVERNILLRNTIWPRRAHLEIVDYPEDLRIPRDSSPPALRVRAWKYIVADEKAPEGWRLLTWDDLKNRSDLGGDDVPDVPAYWTPRSSIGFTVDEADLKLADFPLRETSPNGDQEGKWFIADDTEESGWRKLKWKDLNKERLGGVHVPGLPGEWDKKGQAAMIAGSLGMLNRGSGALDALQRVVIGPQYVGMTVGEVEEKLAAADPKKTPNHAAIKMVFATLERLARIRDVLDRVDARAADRSMRRTLRRLAIPGDVTLVYSSNRATNTNTMTAVGGNEFTGSFGDLKDTISFDVRAEDYRTASRTITVVDRPRLEKLESTEERPAYLYYRPGENTESEQFPSWKEIRGRRQPFKPVSLSVSGDTTTTEVPSGTSLLLTATFTKNILSVERGIDLKYARDLKAEKPELIDPRNVTIKVPDIRREQRFILRFTDEDNVTAERKIIIVPKEDVTPRVSDFLVDDVIRRGKEGYLVAVGCRIPFRARVRDDHGLARLRYACKVIPGDFLTEQSVRALFGVGAVPLMGPGPGTQWMTGLGYLTALHRERAGAVTEEASAEQEIDLGSFLATLAQRKDEKGRGEYLRLSTFETLIREPQSDPFRKLLNDFAVTPDRWTEGVGEDSSNPRRWVRAQDQRAPVGNDLALWRLLYKDKPLKDPDDTKAQKRFLIEVRLLADDTWLEGDLDPKTRRPIPHTGASGETLTFVIVPENELLSKIGEEEDVKYRELQKAYKPLPEFSTHVRDISSTLGGGVPAGELNGYLARCDALLDVLKTSKQDTRAVEQTYERIVREMRVNQLNEDVVAKVYTTIYEPLTRIGTNFDKTTNTVSELRKALDGLDRPAAAREAAARAPAVLANTQMLELVREMEKILNAMAKLVEFNDLLKIIVEVEKRQGELGKVVQDVHKKRIKEYLEGDKPKTPDER